MICEGIYVTLGQDQIKERSYREHVEDFQKCDGENFFYWWRLGNRPIKKFTEVFIVIGNKVRWKARFLDYGPSGEVEFSGGRKIYAKCWMLLIDFEKLPAPYEYKKGFQGFRYKN